MHFSRVSAPLRMLLSPLLLSSPNVDVTPGLRKSASRISTRHPFWARVIARLRETDVLPSFGWALVTSKVFGGCSAVDKRIAVRSARKDSESAEPELWRTDKSTLLAPDFSAGRFLKRE